MLRKGALKQQIYDTNQEEHNISRYKEIVFNHMSRFCHMVSYGIFGEAQTVGNFFVCVVFDPA